MILPKIDTIQLTLLKPDVPITDFIKYGYGIYFFFYYLKSLLITFGVLLIFAIYYICIIFFKYYRDYEDEYSLFFDYNLLSLVSGVQIIKFRKYFIETHGKEEFLEKHKNFDVFYREHFIVGNGLFGIVIIINFIFLFISLRKYHGFKNKDITNYNTLIFSGDDNPEIIEEKAKKEEIKDTNIKKKKILSEKEITDKIGVDNVEIQYTIKKSDYYKKMDKLNKLSEKNDVVLYRINKKKCCPHKLGSFTCCCLCRCCFDCCGVKNKLDTENEKLTGQINKIENELKEMDEKEEDIKINELEEQKNQLYLLTFHNIQDYEKVYNKFPSNYLWYKIKTCCRKNTFFINKAPNPEDIAWKNLEFQKGYRYIRSKCCIFGIFMGHIALSFVIQLVGEIIDNFLSDYLVYFFVVNIIIALLLSLLDDFVSDNMSKYINDRFKYWSYSDITFYSILYQTIFKFISKGVFPLLTYYLFYIVYRVKHKEDIELDYEDLVQKMFVIIEMDGFGYPLIDWLFNIVPKLKNFYNSNETILSPQNIEKEISDVTDNSKGLTDLELKEAFEKEELDLEGNYSDVLSLYYITMFYFSIYPIGVIQTFLIYCLCISKKKIY